MATYEESGVNIDLGDKCSKIAYEAAKATFPGRRGKIGEPVLGEGGFAGLLDMGEFYLVQNDDGVGTKIQIAEAIGKYDTLGYDLLAMVADDAICLGAEPISVSNTLDVDKVNPEKIEALMDGLKNAALEHKIVIPGGEIAELGNMVNGYLWNATCVAVVEKSKLITGKNIQKGDKIIGLHSVGLRSNGFSLVRHILSEKFGKDWHSEKFNDSKTWGEATLTPSKIYASTILDMHGRYGEKPKVEIKGIAHVTGGGIYGNLNRISKNYKLDNLPAIPELMGKLMELGEVSEEEAYKTWNMGLGMILISNDVEQIKEICGMYQITAQVIGEIL
ncbi:MAG: phosphoribosylformylglycinamidine cyclo-ligase [bacterium]|nr:phosphoribosylformylglycinamidine cyclo-ligase [bacterium]